MTEGTAVKTKSTVKPARFASKRGIVVQSDVAGEIAVRLTQGDKVVYFKAHELEKC